MANLVLHYSGIITTTGGVAVSAVTPSFTPQANALLIVIAAAGNGNTGGDISGSTALAAAGGSLTHTRRQSIGSNVFGYTGNLSSFTAPVGGSPSAMTVTVSSAATSDSAQPCRVALSVFSLTGYDTGSPFGSSFTANIGADKDAYQGTLSAAPASTSYVFGARFMVPEESTTSTATPGAGWTEMHDVVDPYGNLHTQYRTGSTSTAVDWADLVDQTGTLTVFWEYGLGFEIRIAAGGTAYTGNVSETVTISEGVGAVATRIAGVAESVTISESIAASAGASRSLTESLTVYDALKASTQFPAFQKSVHVRQAFMVPDGADVTTAPIDTSCAAFVAIAPIWLMPGDLDPPTDNSGNSYPVIITADGLYPTYPEGGLRWWADYSATPRSGHTWTKHVSSLGGSPELFSETTLTVVELENVTRLEDHDARAWTGGTNPHVTSGTVTCAGPAVLIASFCGEQYTTGLPVADDASWQLLQNEPADTNSVHTAVFGKVVRTGGTHSAAVQFNGPLNGGVVTIAAFAGVGAFSAALSESLTLSEALGAVRATVQGLTESSTLSDAVSAIAPRIAGISESLTWQDALAGGAAAVVAAQESLTISDALSAVLGAAVAASESVTVADALACVASYVSGLSESTTLADSIAAIRATAAGLSETVTISEAAVAVMSALSGVSESWSWLEAVALDGQNAYSAALAEGITWSDALASLAGYLQGVADTVATAESVSNANALVGDVAETVTVSESLSAAGAFLRELSEFSSVSDAIGAILSTAQSLPETMTIADAVGAGRAFIEALSEALAWSEASLAEYSARQTLTENPGWIESLLAVAHQLIVHIPGRIRMQAERQFHITVERENMDPVKTGGTIDLTFTTTDKAGALYNPEVFVASIRFPDGRIDAMTFGGPAPSDAYLTRVTEGKTHLRCPAGEADGDAIVEARTTDTIDGRPYVVDLPTEFIPILGHEVGYTDS